MSPFQRTNIIGYRLHWHLAHRESVMSLDQLIFIIPVLYGLSERNRALDLDLVTLCNSEYHLLASVMTRLVIIYLNYFCPIHEA